MNTSLNITLCEGSSNDTKNLDEKLLYMKSYGSFEGYIKNVTPDIKRIFFLKEVGIKNLNSYLFRQCLQNTNRVQRHLAGACISIC